MLQFSADIKRWGLALGFNQVGITDTNLQTEEAEHQAWIAKGFHGEMNYMAKHGVKRTRPAELVPNTTRIISVRLDYLPPNAADSETVLHDNQQAFISRYALGRDYHKVMRQKLQKLSSQIQTEIGLLKPAFFESALSKSTLLEIAAPPVTPMADHAFNTRVFTDSAPVLEVALAEKSGLGWRGKHTLLINKDRGSWFFLGEIYTDLPLPIDVPTSNHCGTCTQCITVCPTQAIVAPYQLDARRCISYLTIELKGSIPIEFRPLIGNRVYGCDDCQLTCPWNKFAHISQEPDFSVKHGLDNIRLVDCFAWSAETFNSKLAGSAIYRIGYKQWLRNIAVGLGNATGSSAHNTKEIIAALQSRSHDECEILREHVAWALLQHGH